MDNFVRADSSNLPKVDLMMVIEFMKSSDKHNMAEIRGAKALTSSRESYVENAVGYVEIKRTGSLCDVRAKVVPEHKISNKYYIVTVNINDVEHIILDTSCDGCAAAAGGCKHTLVLLYWLHNRSSEPSSTSVECYWVKPNLKLAPENIQKCKELFKDTRNMPMGPKDPAILENFRAEARKHSCKNSLILLYDKNNVVDKLTNYCLFNIMIDFVKKERNLAYDNFKVFCDLKVQPIITRISEETKNQVNSKLWHIIRQGRITGSKVYEVAHCCTPNGSLVEEILGGYKVPETKAMKRGKVLEKKVLKIVEQEIKQDIKDIGFILVDGLFGASPDGISDDFVIEVKCPISNKTKKNYINNGQISKKCMGQIQMEMLATKRKKCLFCVADPQFEQNGKVEKIIVDFNEIEIYDLMMKAELFWEKNIFPTILKSAVT